MKKLLLGAFAAAVMAAVSAAPATPAPRIAVIDLQKVFKEYYKSRIAEDFIKQQAEAARLYLGQLTRQLEALNVEARRLETNARNMALDPAKRKEAETEALEAVRKVRAKETEIQLYVRERKQEMEGLEARKREEIIADILQLYVRERKQEMEGLEARKREEIIADIRAEIQKRAAAGGYDWVFDSSGMTTNSQPAVLLFPAKHDISAAVIRELNRRGNPKPKK